MNDKDEMDGLRQPADDWKGSDPILTRVAVQVVFNEDKVKVRVAPPNLHMSITADKCGSNLELKVRRIVERLYSERKRATGSSPRFPIWNVAEVVAEAIQDHPEFPAWLVLNA